MLRARSARVCTASAFERWLRQSLAICGRVDSTLSGTFDPALALTLRCQGALLKSSLAAVSNKMLLHRLTRNWRGRMRVIFASHFGAYWQSLESEILAGARGPVVRAVRSTLVWRDECKNSSGQKRRRARQRLSQSTAWYAQRRGVRRATRASFDTLSPTHID